MSVALSKSTFFKKQPQPDAATQYDDQGRRGKFAKNPTKEFKNIGQHEYDACRE